MPESLSMKCNPKPSYDDFYEDEYPRAPDTQSDERQKTDSGIEIEEANKSVSFSENVQILGIASEFDRSLSGESTDPNDVQQPPRRVPSTINTDGVDILHVKDEANDEPSSEKKVKRKEGIISDSIDQKSTRDFDLDLKVYEKTPETEDLIKSAISLNDFVRISFVLIKIN